MKQLLCSETSPRGKFNAWLGMAINGRGGSGAMAS